jgi:hypothetical protein
MTPRHIDEHAIFRAHNQHWEEHQDTDINHVLATIWEQHKHGLLTLNEWVIQLSALPPL